MGIETSRTTRGARTTREGVAVRAVRARDGFERRGDARKSDDADGRLARCRLAVQITAISHATFCLGVTGHKNFQNY